ncbi:MAG: glycosyltransferase family 4 protein [Gammaproteobacteria bacterium]|nr:glycosyltransferase family 4 protein [Gammaproteobacteria bacterium]
MRQSDTRTLNPAPVPPQARLDKRAKNSMRICIDARSPGYGGIATYAANLIDHLLEMAPDNYYLLLIDPDQISRARPGVDEIIVPSGNPLRWFIWSYTHLPRLLREHRIDVYHTLKHVTAFRIPARSVVTFHGAEMIYRFPWVYAWYDLLYWRTVYPIAARRYDRLLTATDCEMRHFSERKRIPRDKGRTTPLAAATCYQAIDDKERLEEVRRRFALPARFILFVGRFHAIKNLERLVEAFALARPQLPDSLHLVLTGAQTGAYHRRLVRLVEQLGIKDRVRFTGEIKNELPLLFNLAEVFMLMSLYENFGLVLLEAMACGTPVITSDFSDLDEVVDNAAVRVSPTDAIAISDAMIKVVGSTELRDDLSVRGLDQARKFSWERCARETLDVYQELAPVEPAEAVAT